MCLAQLDQSGSDVLGFRISQLTFQKPSALAQSAVGSVLATAMRPSLPSCNLDGTGTFSWLLQLDLVAGTLTTGGSKPPSDPTMPYAFVDEIVSLGDGDLPIAPVTLTAPLGSSCAFTSSTGDVTIPIYLNASATSAMYLPMHGLRFHGAALSQDLGCIGRYNSAGLEVPSGCQADGVNASFVDGGALDAFITLEEADRIIIGALNQSLCVLLSTNPVIYGVKNAQGKTVCLRDADEKIVLQGDWCAASNASAADGCADAARVSATFAAQAAEIQ
ncbi:Hypothetical protein A7982_00586 [Minicystis rosea]|nr:Hypothetical protein A7982_00586 [Minicystis rosea]